MEKKVLVLGAGYVAGPLVRYLLEGAGCRVSVATRTVSKAERIVDGHPKGEALKFTIDESEKLRELVRNADIVVSLLPYTHHITVAKVCLDEGKHLVTTSYVRDEMRELDGAVKDKGLLFLNECGLDPGLDHMSAMRFIHKIEDEGGELVEFHSYCGGLPAPDAKDNPFAYKVSWSPKGVLLACKREAKFLKDGEVVVIPGDELYSDYDVVEIGELGEFEAYPNGDSLPYLEKYGIEGVKTLIRGTYRYPGWCSTWWWIKKLGWLDESERDLSGKTYKAVMRELVGADAESDIVVRVADRTGLSPDDPVIERMQWLGLFDARPIPPNCSSLIDALVPLMEEKMAYGSGERDMIILRHRFVWKDAEGKMRNSHSTFIGYGEPDGMTIMAKTVGLPAAIATEAILEGKIELVGVQIPTVPELYEPILTQLEKEGITFVEETE